jgi:hypothetical protein
MVTKERFINKTWIDKIMNANTGMQKYLDSAIGLLGKYGLVPQKDNDTSKLSTLLQEVVSVDEPKVLAIAKTLDYMGGFNELVRDNVGDMRVANRYSDITNMFDSIRDDSKKLVSQMEDGKIDLKEKVSNLWMKLTRGTPHNRFNKIVKVYNEVYGDTKTQLEKEDAIIDSYIDFRFALKNAEILSQEVLKEQETNLKDSETKLKEAEDKFSGYSGSDNAEKSRLQLERDEASRIHSEEDKKYQLIKDISENLSVGYNVGETLVAKLKQTSDIKDQVYRRAMTFFSTNEHVFTVMDAVYTSQHGLNEATQALESMKEGANKGLEDIAELGNNLEKAALKAGYGSTLNPQSVQKLVDAIVKYQLESKEMIEDLRKESTKSKEEIERIVDEGKKKCLDAVNKFSLLAAQ